VVLGQGNHSLMRMLLPVVEVLGEVVNVIEEQWRHVEELDGGGAASGREVRLDMSSGA
jgi:hypothetical protein